MTKTFVACSVLASETEKAFAELGLTNRIHYLDSALHVDFSKMQRVVTASLIELKCAGEQAALIFGTRCHPDMEKIVESYGADIICGGNCIEILLGEDKVKELNNECSTFYLTSGWLQNWRDIFSDPIDARINFGRYERILLLDTGLTVFSDEEILEFSDFVQVPIEIYPISLKCLKKKILEMLN